LPPVDGPFQKSHLRNVIEFHLIRCICGRLTVSPSCTLLLCGMFQVRRHLTTSHEPSGNIRLLFLSSIFLSKRRPANLNRTSRRCHEKDRNKDDRNIHDAGPVTAELLLIQIGSYHLLGDRQK